MIKAVLFDLDNTLYDYDTVNEYAEDQLANEVLNLYGMSHEEFTKQYGLAKEEVKRELAGTAPSHNRALYLLRFIENTQDTVHPRRILKLYNTYWDSLLSKATPLPNAITMLQNLKSMGLKITLVTNLTTHIQLRKVGTLGLSDYIDYIVTSEEAGHEKPHPTTFLLALSKLKMLPENAVFVGDDPISDVEGSKAVGMKAIRLKFGKHSDKPIQKDHMQSDYEINDLVQVIDIIAQLNGSSSEPL